MTEEEKWCEQIIILMKVAKMTLTEINSLSDNKRAILSKYFMDSLLIEQENQKREQNIQSR
jgi:hypothetical protein